MTLSYADFVRRTITLMSIILVTGLVAIAVWELASILLIVFFCWVLSVGLDGLVRIYQRRLRIGRGLAGLLVVISLLLFFALVAIIVVPPFVSQFRNLIESLPGALESLVGRYEDLRANSDLAGEVLPEFTLEDYENLIGTSLETETTSGGGSRFGAINLEQLAGSVLPLLGGIGSLVGGFIANLTLIILITGYLIADPLVYYRPIIALVPASREKRAVELINEIERSVISWMSALSVSITFTSVAVTVVLGVILRIPNPVALGVLAGLGTLVPNLGYYIGLIPVVIFTAVADPAKVIPAALLYWAINEFEGKVIAPNVIKNELNIPAGVIIPFQLIAAAVLGFFGILLAIPLLAIIVVLVRELYVFDILGKRGRSSDLDQTLEGEIYLTTRTEPAADSIVKPAGT